MKKIIFSLALLFCPIISFGAVTASGWHWNASTVNWYHNNASLSSSWRSAIKSARSTWTATGASISFYSKGDTSRTGGADGKNVWYAQNLGSGSLASVYASSADSSTMHLLDVDTVINTYYSWSTSGASGYYDVQDVATHEWGHWLSLLDDYYYETWDADNTMYEVSFTGSTYRRTLTSEDVAGILSIYP